MDRLRLAAVAALSIALTVPVGISLLPTRAWAADSNEESQAATQEPSKEKKEEKKGKKEKKKGKGLSLWNRLRTEESEEAPRTSPEAPEGEVVKIEAARPIVEVEPVAPNPPEPVPPPPAPKGPKLAQPHAREERPAPPAKARPLTPRSLSKVHGQILMTPLAQDPIAKGYLEAVENGDATPERLNEFAIYLGRKGYTGAAVEVQEEAVRRSPKDPLFLINLGTLHREAGTIGLAKRDFRKAIALDPNNAFAYYNLGAVLDAEARYDEAVETYKKALRLDPSLADPRRNPQVVNNQRLLAVSLLLYRERAGALGLPLLSAAPAAGDAATRAKKSKAEGSPERP